MKAVILAGGLGTRISEESTIRPKPMVEIGGRPMIWHIMKIYASHGIDDFIICAGYRGYMIKEYFANYFLHESDITVDIAKNSITTLSTSAEPWKVTIVDTGADTMTGGRIRRVADYVGDETFCMTYGDCVSSVDVSELIAFHRTQGALATLTAIQPPGRFGALALADESATIGSFEEKPAGDRSWVNGGFFVLEPRCSTTSTVMRRSGSGSLCSASRQTASWRPTGMPGTGRTWTRARQGRAGGAVGLG